MELVKSIRFWKMTVVFVFVFVFSFFFSNFVATMDFKLNHIDVPEMQTFRNYMHFMHGSPFSQAN